MSTWWDNESEFNFSTTERAQRVGPLCPRCGGWLSVDSRYRGEDRTCLSCGYVQYSFVMPALTRSHRGPRTKEE